MPSGTWTVISACWERFRMEAFTIESDASFSFGITSREPSGVRMKV